MSHYLNTSGVSLDLQNSWAARSLQEALRQTQNNEQRDFNYYQAKFQQRQMQEKEEKLLRLYENQQQRAFEKVSRGSSGGSSVSTSPVGASAPGKVRQMFDERRQKAGIDRSYPLEPLKQARTNVQNKVVVDRPLKTITKTTSNSTRTQRVVQNTNKSLNTSFKQQRNGNYERQSQNNYEELEYMMNNHNLNDNLDDEQLPHYDEVDRDLTPSPNENYNNSLPTTPVKNNIKPKPAIVKKAATEKQKMKPAANRNVRAVKPAVSAGAGATDNLTPCKFCSRRFAADRLSKHEEVCSRTSRKKRKVYDAVKHRVQGTEVEGYAKKGPKGTTSVRVSKPPQMPKTDWRRQHEDFIATIRAAKVAQAHVAAGGKLSDLPPPPPSVNPDYVQCPHCGRRFNEAAAARHIPKCATMLHNKPNRLPNAPKKRF